MVTFEQAYEIAKKLKSNIDGVNEYDKGYEFTAEVDKFTFGGDGAVCVLKENGRAVCQTEFYDRFRPTFIKSRKL